VQVVKGDLQWNVIPCGAARIRRGSRALTLQLPPLQPTTTFLPATHARPHRLKQSIAILRNQLPSEMSLKRKAVDLAAAEAKKPKQNSYDINPAPFDIAKTGHGAP